MKIFQWFISFLAWLQIVASPLIVGLVISFFVYKNNPNKTGLIWSILISAVSLIIGIIIATRIGKKHGTVDFVSKISSSPDFDKLDDENK
ncbi:MAG TPA: hypothetical protein VHB70_02325 [Parafilimonas sp.]|nr:hypothetical protein [Parafilimonas sp.]